MDLIASEEDLRSFQSLPDPERKLNEPLKGVLREIALTGVLRYPWQLVKSLLRLVLKEVLQDFHTEAISEVGPARPLLENETVEQVLARFLGHLDGFTDAPWTIQRLCEILLEPHKQYSRLHKVVMAIEKLLLVTGEVPVDPTPPPPPALASLGPVNENPPPVYGTTSTAADLARKRLRTDEESARITSAVLTIKPDPTDASPSGFSMDVDDPPGPSSAPLKPEPNHPAGPPGNPQPSKEEEASPPAANGKRGAVEFVTAAKSE